MLLFVIYCEGVWRTGPRVTVPGESETASPRASPPNDDIPTSPSTSTWIVASRHARDRRSTGVPPREACRDDRTAVALLQPAPFITLVPAAW